MGEVTDSDASPEGTPSLTALRALVKATGGTISEEASNKLLYARATAQPLSAIVHLNLGNNIPGIYAPIRKPDLDQLKLLNRALGETCGLPKASGKIFPLFSLDQKPHLIGFQTIDSDLVTALQDNFGLSNSVNVNGASRFDVNAILSLSSKLGQDGIVRGGVGKTGVVGSNRPDGSFRAKHNPIGRSTPRAEGPPGVGT